MNMHVQNKKYEMNVLYGGRVRGGGGGEVYKIVFIKVTTS